MKKTLKSFLICTVALLATFTTISCSNLANSPTDFKPNPKHAEAIKNFGTNPVIYSSAYNPSRFYTSQVMNKPFWGLYNNIVFEANLVQYDSLDENITKYVESLPTGNALMHQPYKDVNYISGKTYVELASYTDMDNGEIIMFEVRIFDGDFWKNRNDDGWYAKSVTFSPDFKIDIDKNINIETRAREVYKYPYAIYEGEAEDNSQIHNKYKDDLNINEALYLDGDITTKMYNLGKNPVHYDKYSPITCINTDEYFVISRLYEYDSLTQNAETKYDELNDEGWLLWTGGYKNETFDKSKRYIELMAFVNRVSDEITSYQLRFKIPNLETNMHKAKGICLTPAQFNELTN